MLFKTINKVKHWIVKKEDPQNFCHLKRYPILTVDLCKNVRPYFMFID